MNKLIAHRGIHNKDIKENSYEGIKKALECDKYLGVEFDIRVTKDNEFIVYHDSLYNNKLIKNIKYRELPKYIPRLEDILRINSNKIFLIEIKNIDDRYKELIKLLDKYKSKNIYVMSFSNKVINKMNKSGRCYKIGILNYILNTSVDYQKLDFICILNSLISDDIINLLNTKEIFSYGLNIKKEYQEVFYIVDD